MKKTFYNISKLVLSLTIISILMLIVGYYENEDLRSSVSITCYNDIAGI